MKRAGRNLSHNPDYPLQGIETAQRSRDKRKGASGGALGCAVTLVVLVGGPQHPSILPANLSYWVPAEELVGGDSPGHSEEVGVAIRYRYLFIIATP